MKTAHNGPSPSDRMYVCLILPKSLVTVNISLNSSWLGTFISHIFSAVVIEYLDIWFPMLLSYTSHHLLAWMYLDCYILWKQILLLFLAKTWFNIFSMNIVISMLKSVSTVPIWIDLYHNKAFLACILWVWILSKRLCVSSCSF